MNSDYNDSSISAHLYDSRNIASMVDAPQESPPSYEEAMGSPNAPPLSLCPLSINLGSKYSKSFEEFHNLYDIDIVENNRSVRYGNKISTCSKRLVKDIDALSSFLLYHSMERPTLAMHVKGVWYADSFSPGGITDFSYSIDLTDYIETENGMPDIYGKEEHANVRDIYQPSQPQIGAQTIEEYDCKIQEKIKPVAKRYLNQFINSGDVLKRVTLRKSVSINFEALKSLVLNRLRKELNYRGNVSIEFFSDNSTVEVQKKTIMRNPKAMFWCCVSCAWMVALPVYLMKSSFGGSDKGGAKADKELFKDLDEKERVTKKHIRDLRKYKVEKNTYATSEEYHCARKKVTKAIKKCETHLFTLQQQRRDLKEGLKDSHKILNSVWAPVFPQGREDILYEAIKEKITTT
eukprot:Nk52_evm13s289 gene=Nk52_evmTU13s289